MTDDLHALADELDADGQTDYANRVRALADRELPTLGEPTALVADASGGRGAGGQEPAAIYDELIVEHFGPLQGPEPGVEQEGDDPADAAGEVDEQ